jgi:hypothetical protein
MWDLGLTLNQGGHVDSYTDPATGRSFEYGVQNYINVTGALRHFNRLGVPMQLNVRSTNVQRNVDFSTGVELTGYVPPAAADRTAALNKFVDLTEQWRTRMEPGYHNFWPAGQVPEDLLLPFGEWVVKHNLTAAVPTFFSTTGFGTDDLLAKPTLGVIRSINPDLILTLLGRLNSLIPVSRRNQDIYDRSRVVIGDQDILFDSTVVTSNLPCNGAQGNATLFVQNARTGAITVVVAKRVIFTAVPSEANLAPFAIRQETKNLLSKLTYSTVYAAVVSHQSLPVNTTLVNVRSAAVPDNYLNSIPRAPFNTRFEQYADSSYYRAVATGDAGFTANQAKNVMQQALDKMIQAGTIPQSRIILPLYFNAFESHGLMSAQLSSDKIRDGVWNQIEAEYGDREIVDVEGGSKFGVGFISGPGRLRQRASCISIGKEQGLGLMLM